MNTKILNLVQRNSLILRNMIIRDLMPLRISPERPNLNLTSRNSPRRINNNSQERLLILLVKHLSRDINTREPASIPRVRVIPSHNILQSPSLHKVGNFIVANIKKVKLNKNNDEGISKTLGNTTNPVAIYLKHLAKTKLYQRKVTSLLV